MLTDDQGVFAIISLQKMIGVDEPIDKARRGWAALSEMERNITEAAYLSCCGSREDLEKIKDA